jgi:hypothetical protein
MRMDVEVQELLGLRLEAGGDGAIERVRWSRLGDSTRRRFGGGLHILNLDRARARDESRCEQGRRDHSPFARHTHSERVCTAGLGGLKTTLRPADPSAPKMGLGPSCGTSPQENFRVAEDWLVRELGSPQSSEDSRVAI